MVPPVRVRRYPETDDAVPLVPGCPVQMKWNVWGDDGKPVILNGQFGKFLGWTIPEEGTKSKISPFKKPGGANKHSKKKGDETETQRKYRKLREKAAFAKRPKQYRIINRLKMKGKARVEMRDGTIHELGVIKVCIRPSRSARARLPPFSG